MSKSPQPNASVPVAPAARPTDLKRRRFLLTVGVGGAGAAAVATQALVPPMPASAPVDAAAEGQGYRETQHVRDYYATTRI